MIQIPRKFYDVVPQDGTGDFFGECNLSEPTPQPDKERTAMQELIRAWDSSNSENGFLCWLKDNATALLETERKQIV
jgi:hypothetical protein